jgi:hypothetical protein
LDPPGRRYLSRTRQRGQTRPRIGKGRDAAVIIGDLMHSPIQGRYPELPMRADTDPKQSAQTRRSSLERYCETDTLCCTVHFPSPSSGRIARWGEGFRCKTVGTPVVAE